MSEIAHPCPNCGAERSGRYCHACGQSDRDFRRALPPMVWQLVQEAFEVDGKRVPWETCQTFSGSWGYYRDEHTWKNNKQLLVLLIETVSKGGNLLLNVGPTARGTFDYRADKALAEMGDWMKFNGRSVYGCTQAPEGFPVPPNTLLTYNEKLNRESAYEILNEKIANAAATAKQHEDNKPATTKKSSSSASAIVKMLTSATFVRGVFGLLNKMISK